MLMKLKRVWLSDYSDSYHGIQAARRPGRPVRMKPKLLYIIIITEITEIRLLAPSLDLDARSKPSIPGSWVKFIQHACT